MTTSPSSTPESHPQVPQSAAAFADPFAQMLSMVKNAGITAFQSPQQWEMMLCALALTLDPGCKAHKFIESLPRSRNDYSENDVLNSLSHLGYFVRPIDFILAQSDDRIFPVLLVNADATPILIIAREGTRYKIFKDGDILYLPASYLEEQQKNARAYNFERFDENKTPTSKFIREGTNNSWFGALFGRFQGTITQILAAGLVLNILSLSTPLFVMLIYNRAIGTGTHDIIPMIAVGMSMAIFFEYLLRHIRAQGLSWISARMDNIVGNRIFSHLSGLSPELVERASVSSQIGRIRTFESIRDFFCGHVFLSLVDLPFVLLSALIIYLIAGPLVLVPLGMVLAYGALFYVVYKKIRPAIRLAAKSGTARQQFTIDTFEKRRAIRAYGLSELWRQKFRDLSGREAMAHFRLEWLGMVGETLAHSLTLLAAVATIGFGAHLIWQGMISTGALVAVMILVWRVLTPFYSLCTVIPRLEQLRISILQVNRLMDLDVEKAERQGTSRLSHIQGHVRFNKLALRYDDRSDDVFSNLSFEAKAGDLVAISGENGAGKTSILKLMKGLYLPSQGAITLDGFDLRQIDVTELRRQISYIPQRTDIFDGSIIDNVRLANPLASREEIIQALNFATADEDLHMLPQGFDSHLGRYNEEGLSQSLLGKIALARLYIHDAPILLIDEIPNAALRGKAGQNFKSYLASNKGHRTTFLVTYRNDIMQMADTLIFLRSGEAAQAGTPDHIFPLMMEAA